MENLAELGKEVTMTSVELVEMINEFRKLEGKLSGEKVATLRHDHFMTKIRKELEVLRAMKISLVQINLSKYTNSRGKVYPCYELNKEAVKYLADRTSTTDKVGLLKAYESMGGTPTNVTVLDRFENSFMSKLIDTLTVLDIGIEREYSILEYRVDGYIEELNIAIEYDEAQHKVEPQKSIDISRQKEIEDDLNCTFVRLDYEDTDATNIGKVMKTIMEVR